MKRVLLTGASGFIGRACIPYLHAAGYEVHAVSTQSAVVRSEMPVFWHRADLLDSTQLTQMVAQVQPTHLLHLAWCHTLPGKFWNDTNNFRWVQASLALLEAFAAHGGRRAVLTGTCAEYDWNYGYCSEAHTPLRPSTLYGACKQSLQLLLGAYAQGTDISAAWGRLFFLYGPYEYPDRLVASVIRSLLEGVPARCSSGEQIRDFLHVEDAAAAFAALLESDVSGPVNIASGQPVAVRDVVNKIGDLLQRRDLIQLGARPASPSEPPLLVADVRRLRGEVGWEPRLSLDTGLQDTLDFWSANLGEL